MELGRRIKELRLSKNMTLNELSKKAEVSMSLLSMVERNRSAPTVRTLSRIVNALGTTVSQICFDEENSRTAEVDQKTSISIIHKNKREKLLLGPERAKAHYELLTPDYRRKLQVMYIHFPVGKKGVSITHEGEECGIILEGSLKAYIGDQTFVLEEGDTVYLDSSIPHRWENIGETEVRAFWINTPATF
jgi:transcriptional regulator with XRE-family HTH domain